MDEMKGSALEKFRFRDLHPGILMGTASDRYAGWTGQVYSENRYEKSITPRVKKVGSRTFTEEVLPVESVREYFQHFRVLEIDYTFYRTLIDSSGMPTQNFYLLRSYRQYADEEDRLLLKVPQFITAKRILRNGAYIENDTYLNSELFTRRFYEPAVEILDSCLHGFVFEQEYQRKEDRTPPERQAEELDRFFSSVPADPRYHLELRTERLLSAPVFDVLEKHGVGQVLSHWTWLSPLSRQFSLSGRRFFNGGKRCVIRLMTPRDVRYEDAYALAHPFNALVDGMLDRKMVTDTAELMIQGVNEGIEVSVIVNNRSGGNAPLIVQKISRQFLDMIPH
ncbi:MAG TPA: DUF72 domain-containing protein [Desulfobacteraceae bacterium]|nr:DUF72 domain-containing protein [Desulfobacteraceae bacterium]